MPLVATPTLETTDELVRCFAEGRIAKVRADTLFKCSSMGRDLDHWKQRYGGARVHVQSPSDLVNSYVRELCERYRSAGIVELKAMRELSLRIGRLTQVERFSQEVSTMKDIIELMQTEFREEVVDSSFASMSCSIESLQRRFARLRTYSVVNTRKVPNFSMEIHKVFEQWRFLYNFLWIGYSSGELHFDEWDNVLVQMSGRKAVLLFEPSLTYAIDGGHYCGSKVPSESPLSDDTLETHRMLKYLPYHRVELNPGEGVVIPAGAYHAALALNNESISLNSFCITHYKKGPQPAFRFPSTPTTLVEHTYIATTRRIYDLTGKVLFKIGPYEYI